jgi:hypothetical protein
MSTLLSMMRLTLLTSTWRSGTKSSQAAAPPPSTGLLLVTNGYVA